ncbi:ABC transporter substrate-binding protein [Leeuwenhoekiella parthenopeia]|uniref:Helical backbone metal receptor n=1 Tax=Leeuwenhoekiella parthenopeia TaxID=2890320 RepID=A0ABS8GZU7_9FLAO|nr:helical backbone metal receptor [Leeuwenhoekiella parthenopeia]MCC4214088.1 helical backbone metal receptor [Leeuwenhoekiella parthenopeia]
MNDQLGRILTLTSSPQRIVCLVPSLTELLVDLGLENRLVGITKFCVHPNELRTKKTVVGGTKTIHLDRIAALKPDFILCNKEENTPEIVESCSVLAPVYVSDIISFEDVYALLADLGELFQMESKTNQLTQELQNRISVFQTKTVYLQKRSVGYLIWNDPLMVAGNDTFINSILNLLGLRNAFAHKKDRYPVIGRNDLKLLDIVLLSSEPFPFKEKHIEAFKQNTQAEIILVDGEYFSWYGTRLLPAFDYFEKLLEAIN